MSARKPCGRIVMPAEVGKSYQSPDPSDFKHYCGYERMKGKQRCLWHWLAAQSSDLQAAAATARMREAGKTRIARMRPDLWPHGERWCAGCQSFVPLFYTSGSRCKACNSMAGHARRLEDNYGITAEEYASIFERQGGRCAICRARPRTKRFAVDHDHKTGEVRGILCKRCNHDLLGGGHDSVDTLWRAVKYLLEPPARGGVPLSNEMAMDRLRTHLAVQRQAVPALPPPF